MRKELFIDIETNDSLDSKTGVITQIGYIYRVNGKLKEEKKINNHDNHNRNLYKTFKSCLDKMVDKYNVSDLSGGEYPRQDGFGWTNGVLLKLLSEK